MSINKIYKVCINNDLNELIKLLNKDDNAKSELYKSNYDDNNNSVLHLCILFNSYEVLFYLLENFPELSTLQNKNGQTFLHLMFRSSLSSHIDLDKLFTILNNIDIYNILDNDNLSILHYIISSYTDHLEAKNKNSTLELITKIFKYCDITKFYKVPILIYVLYITPCYELVEVLIKLSSENHRQTINQKDDKLLSPLLVAINICALDIIKLLLDNDADINYAGSNDSHLPINIGIKQNNNNIIKLLLDYKPNLNLYDNHYNTPLHNFLLRHKSTNYNNIDGEILIKLIEQSDVNKPNLKGYTSLHLLAKYNLINQFNLIDILKTKELNLTIKTNRDKKTPIDYMMNDNYIKLLNKISNNKILNTMANNKISNETNKINKIKKIKMTFCELENCRTQIKHQMINLSDIINITNYPIFPGLNKTNSYDINKNVLFNSDAVHNLIYMIQILRKNDNIFIPYQDLIPDKCMNMMLNIENLNIYRTDYGNILCQFLRLYTEHFFEITPHLIIWRDININYIDKNIGFYISKILKNQKIRFVLFKLSLIPFSTMTHANILLYDKKLNKMERFEPYGLINSLHIDMETMDNHLEMIFKQQINNNIQYHRPKDFMSNTKFQLISNENDPLLKKISDPAGFCLAWCLWFVELRITYPDIDTETLLEDAFSNILSIDSENNDSNDDSNDEQNNQLLSYIRNYADKLDRYRSEFLAEINIKNNYNISFNKKTRRKLFSYIMDQFNRLIQK